MNQGTKEGKDEDDCKIEDLCLDFTFPGHPDWELKESGSHINVTQENLLEYLNLVVYNFVEYGVQVQLSSFKEGFEEVFPLKNLKPLYADELKSIICGVHDDDQYWTTQALTDSVLCEHGYNSNSTAVRFLVNVLTNLTRQERNSFLLFITGCPRLPIGGWKQLSPPFTVVQKKTRHGYESPDQYLPSVMTCANYLKLPNYSSEEVLYCKLSQAMTEGAKEFHLTYLLS
eukprot:CAMPEP_0174273194 /NCGR_PEP_ID=MMETSP0439-20130205/53765_1 /TAXON_ID=0 /ORGANISM="Stereomyxa ramosa, Strain Chinc5" /LENGTH=228 /DNA_ID=CAMNT_0015364199 /DNA_START=99 /DNA_END=783 /DNA_ORIENTATION=-